MLSLCLSLNYGNAFQRKISISDISLTTALPLYALLLERTEHSTLKKLIGASVTALEVFRSAYFLHLYSYLNLNYCLSLKKP